MPWEKNVFFIQNPFYKTSEIYFFLTIIIISDNTFENLSKTDKSLENYKLLKLIQEEIKHLNDPKISS